MHFPCWRPPALTPSSIFFSPFFPCFAGDGDAGFPDLGGLSLSGDGAYGMDMDPAYQFAQSLLGGGASAGHRPTAIARFAPESPHRAPSPAGSASSKGSGLTDFSDIMVEKERGGPGDELLAIPSSPVTVGVARPSNHAGPLYDTNCAAVMTKMQPYLRSYAVLLTPVPVPGYVRKALREEGCPLCVNAQLMPGSPCVALTCVEHGCHHAAHLECAVAPYWVNRLLPSHPPFSSFVKATPSPRVCVLPLPDAHPSPIGRCYLELSIHHVVSGGRALHVTAHDAPVWYGAHGRPHFLHLLGDTSEELTPVGGCAHLPRLTSSTSAGVSIPSSLIRLPLPRGRLQLMCKSHTTGESWRYNACFDLTTVVPDVVREGEQAFPAASGGGDSGGGGSLSPVQLVFSDPVTGNKLAMRLSPIRVAGDDAVDRAPPSVSSDPSRSRSSSLSSTDARGSSMGEPELEPVVYAVSMVRYEFGASGPHHGHGHGHTPAHGQGQGGYAYPQAQAGGYRGPAPYGGSSGGYGGGARGVQGAAPHEAPYPVDVGRKGRGGKGWVASPTAAHAHGHSHGHRGMGYDSRSDGYGSGVWADSEGSDVDSEGGWRSGSSDGSVGLGYPRPSSRPSSSSSGRPSGGGKYPSAATPTGRMGDIAKTQAGSKHLQVRPGAPAVVWLFGTLPVCVCV